MTRFPKISIHSLLAEGDPIKVEVMVIGIGISIHSLLAEGDARTVRGPAASFEFQSTPSSRRETFRVCVLFAQIIISIHSLLAEGDTQGALAR